MGQAYLLENILESGPEGLSSHMYISNPPELHTGAILDLMSRCLISPTVIALICSSSEQALSRLLDELSSRWAGPEQTGPVPTLDRLSSRPAVRITCKPEKRPLAVPKNLRTNTTSTNLGNTYEVTWSTCSRPLNCLPSTPPQDLFTTQYFFCPS